MPSASGGASAAQKRPLHVSSVNGLPGDGLPDFLKSIVIVCPSVTQTTISSLLFSLTLVGSTLRVVPLFVTSTTFTFTFRLGVGVGVGVCAPSSMTGNENETNTKAQNHREAAKWTVFGMFSPVRSAESIVCRRP